MSGRRVALGDGLYGVLHLPVASERPPATVEPLPARSEPRPAIVWNHGSEQQPVPQPRLAALYGAAGYALLLPHRRGHGDSPGEYPIAAARARLDADGRDRLAATLIEVHERYRPDVAASLAWLRGQPFVDPRRIAVSGVSHGAVQALLAASDGVAACVAFAPAAMAWPRVPELRGWLVDAVRAAAAPTFLLQAENDYDLGPSRALGAELARKGGLNRARVYPPYGGDAQAGHAGFACDGTDVWGDDVLDFLDVALSAPTRAVERPEQPLGEPPAP